MTMSEENTMQTINRATRARQALALYRQVFPRNLIIIALITGAIFLLQLAIAAYFSGRGEVFTGSAPIILAIFVFVTAIMSMTQYLPLALGLGLTRHAFLLASLVHASILAIVLTGACMLLALVEHVTDGWWLGFTFFDVAGELTVHPASAIAIIPLGLLAVASLGLLLGAIHTRWGGTGAWVVILGTLAAASILGSIESLASLARSAASIVDSAPMEAQLLGGYALAALVLAALTSLVIRRASI
ncbi:hypothetical protein HT102_03110 [Hoyosella sp. G463]|uniref:Uncharacterized protein n=1 Tax=Lolliginicoccus lacisalsi TaxID=2742202 RepID=A0A927JA57_9ACTN|nr:hypothetical protein [Lolliginicoccus lacisalsi]MBD8505479.1 hypothetical protein [Lolliginicoccus lacisalsi]